MPGPGQIVTDVKVITGGSSDIQCPSGYVKRNTDANKGSGGDYVYTCLQFGSANNPSQGIEELYISSNDSVPCNDNGRHDQEVSGDMNSGVTNGLFVHESLFYCIHRAGTTGGSGRIPHPGEGYNTYFPTPQGKLLHDVQFLVFSADSPPECNSTACVDAGIGALAYLEYGLTIDPYCQSTFGPNYHPLFRPWEYHYSSGDQNSAVPQDSGVFTLNAGSLGKPYIYACGSYINADTTAPTITSYATTEDGQPYTPGTWTNQAVTIRFDCTDNDGGTGVGQLTQPLTDFKGQAAPSYYSGSCTDNAGNKSETTFGPVQIDQTDPVFYAEAYTADGKYYSAGNWTNQSVTVKFKCADVGVQTGSNFYSGLDTSKSNLPADVTFSGEGKNQSITKDGNGLCVDKAGNASNNSAVYDNINIDKTKPVVTASAKLANGQPYKAGDWTNQDVAVSFTCADTGDTQSGLIDNTLGGDRTLSAEGDNMLVSNTGRCVDAAGNVSDTNTFGPVRIDKTAPTIRVSTPANATYLLNQSVPASYDCTDPLSERTTPGSGVYSCTGTVENGSNLDTSSVGEKTFTVSAVDNLGNQSQTVTIHYTVGYNVDLLDQPQHGRMAVSLQLEDANGNNISSADIHVTALCVVSHGASPATSCGDAPAKTLGTTFDLITKGPLGAGGGAYSYRIDVKGLDKNAEYDLLFMADGDPTVHVATFTTPGGPKEH